MRIPRPDPYYLDQMIPTGAFRGKKRWKSKDGKRIYEWDDLHGHIEGYNSRGEHVGVFDAVIRLPEMMCAASRGRLAHLAWGTAAPAVHEIPGKSITGGDDQTGYQAEED